MPALQLQVLPGVLAILRLPPDHPLPTTVFSAMNDFWAMTRTPDELSLVLPEAALATFADAETALIDGGWQAIGVVGTLDFALTGILASLAVPLADAGISIFALSTFDTDYLLVKANTLTAALTVLKAHGFIVINAD